MDQWTIERLQEQHERGEFTCGHPALDTFIRQLVSQYEKRRLGRTFVATPVGATRVAGYYTLAAGSVEVRSLPIADRKKLPKHAIPTIHLGRLAVDMSFQRKGLGELLLLDALRTATELSEKLGAYAVDVWSIDHAAKAFYQKYGFRVLENAPLHLYLPIKTVVGLFDS